MNTNYLVKSARGKTIFIFFYHSFYIIFVNIFKYLYQNKKIYTHKEEKPGILQINDVF